MKSVMVMLALVSADSARADVAVRVARGGSFSSEELGAAIAIRAAPEDDRTVEVAEGSDGDVTVVVGSRNRRVTLPAGDHAARTRIVAVVVTAMLEEPVPAPASDEEQPLAQSVRVPAGRELTVTAFTGILLTSSDYNSVMVGASLGVALRPHVRGVVSAALAQENDYNEGLALMAPLRAGLEGRGGPVALEFGAQALTFVELSCGVPELGALVGPYGVVKLEHADTSGVSFGAELGGYLVGTQRSTACPSLLNTSDSGGWFGVHATWAR